MSMVWVIVRHKDHRLNWRKLMDRDSAYFQDFRRNIEADLEKGCSITISPFRNRSVFSLIRRSVE